MQGMVPAANLRQAHEEVPLHVPVRAQGKRKKGRRRIAIFLIAIVVILSIGVRLYLPHVVTSYLNHLLERNPLYAGRIEAVDLSLWRGAYSIQGIRISRAMGDLKVPLIKIRSLELAIEWRSLLRGEVVGELIIRQPELNFVDSSRREERQTGAEGAWLGLLGDLFPFRINTARIIDGSVSLHSYEGSVPVRAHLSQLQVIVSNLGNVRKETRPLMATVDATALAMDQARCECHIELDPLSYQPTFHLGARVLGLDLTRLNDFARHYGALDFEQGWFDFVTEAEANEGSVRGYAKALFRQLQILDPKSDFKDGKILEGVWQGILSVVAFLLTNHDRHQFGTLIPFQGELGRGTQTDLLAVFVNILRNAFIEAYLPRFEGRAEEAGLLEFASPQNDPNTEDLPEG